MENIILMGCPGSGKTTVGSHLGKLLGLPVLDIDDHYLEPYWGKPVAEMLSDCGSDKFIEEEGKALLNFETNGSVVSLSGSNPMYPEAMGKIKQSGVVVFLDVPISDIIARLEKMKVNRIVGQNGDTTMKEILNYRQQFYEKYYEIRVLVGKGESIESIAKKVEKHLKFYKSKMEYVSTRDKFKKTADFNEVILEGLAPDGGLYVPAGDVYKFTLGELDRLVDLDYISRAVRILEKWIHYKDMEPQKLKTILESAYGNQFKSEQIFPLHSIGMQTHILEMFHGPTASFKDAALQVLPFFFQHAIYKKNTDKKYLMLVATSGDTGGAVLDGFSRHADEEGRIKVMVFYPEKGISEVQKAQMTSVNGNNCRVIGVEADFDACQSFVKKAFNDKLLLEDLKAKNFTLSAANSINWGRLLPQMVYHVSAYLDLVRSGNISMGDLIDICVPTGNFGNILAAFYVQEMGIPIKNLICASNTNNVLTDFIKNGIYDLRSRSLKVTTSPAIDILVSSNLERYLYYLSNKDAGFVQSCFQDLKNDKVFHVPEKMLANIQALFKADWCSEDDCKQKIIQVLKEYGYLLDTHSAVAMEVASRFCSPDVPVIVVSTAHYGKFAPDIARFLGIDTNKQSLLELLQSLKTTCSQPAYHDQLEHCIQMPTCHKDVIKSLYEQVLDKIRNFIG